MLDFLNLDLSLKVDLLFLNLISNKNAWFFKFGFIFVLKSFLIFENKKSKKIV